ncbi:hypothetical protein [Azospirillum thermophilum]|uniref:Uncharacterized protein n=1 Tax=Azospirillum thermophilum TaxID=2202148 RepID=A0A2S2CT21_9PROT|nr:hypothetical protein [Azospirillum thermophilum]AWK87661.1 hypothetical protein DEW08_16855 [Azospirillum thermophilum]
MTVLSEMERERDSLRAFVAVAGDAVESDDIRRLLDLDAQITDARAKAAAKSADPIGQSVLDAMRAVRRSPIGQTINSQTAETDASLRGVERIRRSLGNTTRAA